MKVQALFPDAEESIMMDKEAQDHEFTETAKQESGREASDNQGAICLTIKSAIHL